DGIRDFHVTGVQTCALPIYAMLKAGLVDEVKRLRGRYRLTLGMPSMRAVGYRQVWQYLEGELDEQVMREQAIAATRQLAKRQLTWLRSFTDVEAVADDAAQLAARIR